MWRVAVFCMGVCLSLPASAATLDAVEGKVLINHGKGFQPAATGTEARAGDLVMANPGGSAKLVYPGGCVTAIQAGRVITVNDGSKCPQPMLLGSDDDCNKYTDPNDRDRCWCRRGRDNTDDKQLSAPRCGFIWWPVAAGVALPLAGFLISRENNGGGGGGGGGGNEGGGGGGGGG